jgi:hypothetical protein
MAAEYEVTQLMYKKGKRAKAGCNLRELRGVVRSASPDGVRVFLDYKDGEDTKRAETAAVIIGEDVHVQSSGSSAYKLIKRSGKLYIVRLAQ